MSNKYNARLRRIIERSLENLEFGWTTDCNIFLWKEGNEIEYRITERFTKEDEEQSDEEQH